MPLNCWWYSGVCRSMSVNCVVDHIDRHPRPLSAAGGTPPRRWYTDGPEWMAQQDESAQANLAAANAGLAGVDANALAGLGDAASRMLAARQARSAAQGDYFEYSDLIGQEE